MPPVTWSPPGRVTGGRGPAGLQSRSRSQPGGQQPAGAGPGHRPAGASRAGAAGAGRGPGYIYGPVTGL